MFTRVPAVGAVIVLLSLLVGFPALIAPASAAPRVVRVATHDIEPFVISHDNIKTGFTVDILDEIAKHEGWTVDYVDTTNIGEQLRALSDGKADAAAAAVSITADRADDFDFSQPILGGGLQIMVPATSTGHTSPGLRDFLALLFSKAVLIWLSAAFLLAVIPAHIVWWTERHHHDSPMSKKYFPGIFQAFAYGLGMLAAQPDEFPRHWANRVLGIVLAFVSIIFVAYYTANLTANLTVDKINSQISSPSDLVGKRVCTVNGTTAASFLHDQGIGFSGVPAITDCYAGIKAGTVDAVVFDAPILAYYIANDATAGAALVGKVFQNEDYGIAFRIGSDLRRQADEALLKMQADGDYAMIKQKWFGSGS